MSLIVEVSEEGALYLPPEAIGHAKPHTRYAVETQGAALVLRPTEQTQPFWATATPEEWVARFNQWVDRHADGSNLPAEALRRENIYE